MERTRVAVIGLGTMGSQVLKTLAEEAAVEVVGFEQFSPGHDRGAAGGESRIFRSAQFEDPRYVPILQRADELWGKLEAQTQRELRSMTGCVLMGPPSHQHIRNALASVTDYGLDYDLLDREQMKRKLPQFTMDVDDMAIVDHRAGMIRPELTILSTVLLAESMGADVRRNTQVLDIVDTGAGVTVVTDAGALEFDRVVVSAGPWVTKLLPELAQSISIRRPISVWYAPRPGAEMPSGPAFIRLGPRHFYGVPSPDGISVKVGLSVVDHLVVDEPNDQDRSVSPADLAPFDEILAGYLPTLQPDPIRVTTYFEGYMDDARPIVQAAPGSENVILLAGFSGHGFKIAPAIGEIGALLALGKPTPMNLDFLHRNFTAAP
jgi:sarcosine oxidase